MSNKTIDGILPKVGDHLKIVEGTSKIQGKVGRVIQRRNRKTDFVTHRAGPLGQIWVQFGRRKDNNVVILPIMPAICKFFKQVKAKGGRRKENLDDIFDDFDTIEDIFEGLEV